MCKWLPKFTNRATELLTNKKGNIEVGYWVVLLILLLCIVVSIHNKSSYIGRNPYQKYDNLVQDEFNTFVQKVSFNGSISSSDIAEFEKRLNSFEPNQGRTDVSIAKNRDSGAIYINVRYIVKAKGEIVFITRTHDIIEDLEIM